MIDVPYQFDPRVKETALRGRIQISRITQI